MRKVILSLASVLMILWTAVETGAVPANPRPVAVKQADGSMITVRVFGDERHHYYTTSDGYRIISEGGIFYYAGYENGVLAPTSVKAHDPGYRDAKERAFISQNASKQMMPSQLSSTLKRANLATGFPTTGEIRSIVILANFSDVKFQSPSANSDFSNMLNMQGYSDNGATGSAKDYFMSSSNGKFIPTFDVFGPYDLSRTQEYYGKNKSNGDDNDAEGMIAEACRLAYEAGVNFADYDYNNDNIVDNVFVFFAGTNEADGGGTDKIWPHRYQLEMGESVFNGKAVFVYACTSEQKMSANGPQMAGIGTFVHEFTHVLGLPDFYDTDGYAGGVSKGLGEWSLMDKGPYSNEGRTPPSFSAMERYLAKWIEPVEIINTGNYVLNDLQDSEEAFLIKTDTEGEYFILENRQNTDGWDRYLPGHGMLIYHVDRSSRVVNGFTAYDRWDYNWPNNVASHMCHTIVPAQYNASLADGSGIPFPGARNNREFSKTSNPSNVGWSGKNASTDLLNITEEGGVIRFRAITPYEEIINVEGVSIQGGREIVLNDTAKYTAVIAPENATNRNVEWVSLTPDYIKIDKDGIAHALKEGTGKIQVTTEDGGHSAEYSITIINKQLFRARTVSSNGFPLAGVNVKLSGGKEYQFTSDKSGLVQQEGIAAGNYIVRISGEGFPDQEKHLEMTEGASVCNIILFTEKELNAGTSKIRPDIKEYENSAYITWKSDGGRFRVEWWENGKPETMLYAYTDVPKLNIPDLKKETTYSGILYETDNVIDSHFKHFKFTTCAPTSEYALILLNSMYEMGETIILKAANLPEGAKLEWYINGKKTELPELLLEEREYAIELHVFTEDDEEIITKYIEVIE